MESISVVDDETTRAALEPDRLDPSMFGLLYPVTMISNAFVAPELMPDWLGTIAEWNPLSSTITATRKLFGNPGVEADGWLADHAVFMAVVSPLVIMATMLPVAVRTYQRQRR